MNKVRYYNSETNRVVYMDASCERALKSIGFVKDEIENVGFIQDAELTTLNAEPSESVPTPKKPKKNAAKS